MTNITEEIYCNDAVSASTCISLLVMMAQHPDATTTINHRMQIISDELFALDEVSQKKIFTASTDFKHKKRRNHVMHPGGVSSLVLSYKRLLELISR